MQMVDMPLAVAQQSNHIFLYSELQSEINCYFLLIH